MEAHVREAIKHAARVMHEQPTLQETLEAIVQAATEAIPTFGHVGISITTKGSRIESPAVTTALVRDLDALQYGLGEGPCVDTLSGAEIVVAPDIRHDQRWPRYVGPALHHGLRAQLALRLYLDQDGTVGGLNLYSTDSATISDEDVFVAHLFATHAATALGAARRIDTLTQAMVHRQTIGQAIGILMERYALSEAAAQAFLWRASSHSNTKVRDLAAGIIADAQTGGHDQPELEGDARVDA